MLECASCNCRIEKTTRQVPHCGPLCDVCYWMWRVAFARLYFRGLHVAWQVEQMRQRKSPGESEENAMSWADWFKAALALVLWREARGEGRDGMRAVAHVIRNRVEACHLPDQWEDVIEAKWQFSSMTAPGDSQLVAWPKQPDPKFEDAMQIAALVHGGGDFDLTNGAHFYANLAIVAPDSSFWKIANDKTNHPQTAVIGHHTFFK